MGIRLQHMLPELLDLNMPYVPANPEPELDLKWLQMATKHLESLGDGMIASASYRTWQKTANINGYNNMIKGLLSHCTNTPQFDRVSLDGSYTIVLPPVKQQAVYISMLELGRPHLSQDKNKKH